MSNGCLVLQRNGSRVVVIVCCCVFANSSKLRSSRALPAGHPEHLISFVETDREAYSLSIYSYRGVHRTGHAIAELACGLSIMCAKDAMRFDSDTSMAMPLRCTPVVRIPAIRNADEGEPLQHPNLSPSIATEAMLGRCAGCPAARSLTRLLTTRH